jgi:uncharacterized membrane protein
LARATLVGDLIGVLALLAVGQLRHGEDAASRFVALAVVFVAAWLVTAWCLGTYRPATHTRLMLTLALGIPLGVVLRAAMVQVWTAREILTFAGVVLVFGALFVGTARVLTLWWFGRKDAAS